MMIVRRRSGADGAGEARLGVTIGKKVGNSVVRHRLRRWIKECFRRSPQRARLAGRDVVVHVEPNARELGFHDVERNLSRHLSWAAEAGGGGRSRPRRRRSGSGSVEVSGGSSK